MKSLIKYKVTIDYKKGPSFGIDIHAENKQVASMLANNEARKNGFDEMVKRTTVTEI